MIHIETINHSLQRYDTVGDWQITDDGTWLISVSKMNNWKYEFLVGLHELVECAACLTTGVTQETVDEFDMSFKGDGEPGDDKNCPYRLQHLTASCVELLVAKVIGVKWNEYEAAINALSDH